jgi:O-acetylserine/cysteine efflux transporter
VAVKGALAVLPPLPLATFRCLAAACILLGALRVAGRRLPALRPREWALVVVAGLSGNTIFQLGMAWGLAYTTPAHSALMVNLSPVVAILLAWIWLGERPRARRLAGIALALGGVGLIVTRGGDVGAGSLVGDGLALAAGVGWAVYVVAGKPLLAAHPPLEITTLASVVGAVPLLPLGLPGLVAVPWSTLGARTWLLLAYLSLFTLVLANGLWYWALARATTARVVVFSYLTPVVATAGSILLGQDTVSVPLVLGAGAVVAGVALAQGD